MDNPAQQPNTAQSSAVKRGHTSQVAAAARQRHLKKAGPFILLMGLAVAIITVLLVPMLVGGAAPVNGRASSVQQKASTSYKSVEEAIAAVGFTPVLPAKVPAGYTATAVNVLDGNVLELEYTSGKNVLVYRVAMGSEDLSYDDTEYAFNTTETVDGITRSYSGVSDKKLSTIVWANNGFSYAVVAEDGMRAADLKDMAQAIV